MLSNLHGPPIKSSLAVAVGGCLESNYTCQSTIAEVSKTVLNYNKKYKTFIIFYSGKFKELG